jgi:hypothetical protein
MPGEAMTPKEWPFKKSKADTIVDLLRLCEQPYIEGSLDREERFVLPELIEGGVLRRVWRGPTGFLGLATIEKVK